MEPLFFTFYLILLTRRLSFHLISYEPKASLPLCAIPSAALSIYDLLLKF